MSDVKYTVDGMEYEVFEPHKPHVSDARGDITNLIADGWAPLVAAFAYSHVKAQHLAVITSKRGSIRANHWHPKEAGELQFMFLISGRYRALSRPHGTNGVPREHITVPGEIGFCPPGVDHAYKFLEDSVILNITTTDRSPESYASNTIPLVGDERLIK